METYFAPPQRAERRTLKNQIDFLANSSVMATLLKTASGLLVVLNEDRQIVALNHAFLDSIGITDPEKALGLRLGESLGCVHAHEKPGGCGTTPYCRTCGAALAMMAAILEDRISEEICALSYERDGCPGTTCLQVRAQPIEVDGRRWIMFFAQDITHQFTLMQLERVLFHDMNNLLTSLLGYSALMVAEMPDQENVQRNHMVVNRLHGEIELLRTLSLQKLDSFKAQRRPTLLQDIRQDIVLFYQGHPAAAGKQVLESWPEEVLSLCTDPMLVAKIVGNMILNALEATDQGESIRLRVAVAPRWLVWEVWNPAVIPEKVQNRIFQRYYSTKGGMGRGLGTFSMKLLGEKYLGGEVDFLSTEAKGTIFTFKLPLPEEA